MPPTPPMRLLLLPISTRRTLIYCEPPSHAIPAGDQTRLDKAVNWSSRTWATWEKAPSGWKKTTTTWGNKMLRGIPFEEWGLKSIPGLKKQRRQELERDFGTAKKIEVRYPASFQSLCKGQDVREVCRRLGTERQTLHQRTLVKSVAAMPLTIPFGLLPIIPNLPFFYLAFRAYSHWRALSGSKHLEFLTRNNLLVPHPSETLDSLYSAGLLHPTRADSRESQEPTPEQTSQIIKLLKQQMAGDGANANTTSGEGATASATTVKGGPKLEGDAKGEKEGMEVRAMPKRTTPNAPGQQEEIMLLKGWNGKLIAERLELPGLEVEIERAVEQVERQLNKGGEIKEEKKEVEKNVDGQQQQQATK